MHSLTNWRYSSVTSQAATDAGAGTPILTTGTEARVVTALSAYWGSNTTTSIGMRYFIIPETAITASASNQYVISDLTFPVGFVAADMASGGIMNPLVAIGVGAKGQSNQTLVIPPNSMLVGAPSIAQNGTIIHKCISAEYGV